MNLRLILLLLGLGQSLAVAEETWTNALSRMPLTLNVSILNHTNCAQVLLAGFQSNATAKALIFMPGATDELYFFKRVHVAVTNVNPSLLDAVVALTNQSPLRVTFREPFVLLYSGEDVLELDCKVTHEGTQKKLQAGKPLPHLLAIDRDWTQLLGLMKKKIPVTLLPYERTTGSWHFYRHTFAGWNLTPWEVMETAALAGKTRFTVVRGGVVFEVDPRVGAVPKLDRFPGR
ncbi:MAG: hypothetical protein QM813_06750 [Verrucomicrobiota bacterium]